MTRVRDRQIKLLENVPNEEKRVLNMNSTVNNARRREKEKVCGRNEETESCHVMHSVDMTGG